MVENDSINIRKVFFFERDSPYEFGVTNHKGVTICVRPFIQTKCKFVIYLSESFWLRFTQGILRESFLEHGVGQSEPSILRLVLQRTLSSTSVFQISH